MSIDFQFDPDNWPPTGKKPWTPFSEREDRQILAYIFARKSFTNLGGNEVWKQMASSRTFNPTGRTFHSLRERYRKRIAKCPQRFLTKEQLLILQENCNAPLQALENSCRNRLSIEPPRTDDDWPSNNPLSIKSSDQADEPIRMTPILKERRRLIQTLSQTSLNFNSTMVENDNTSQYSDPVVSDSVFQSPENRSIQERSESRLTPESESLTVAVGRKRVDFKFDTLRSSHEDYEKICLFLRRIQSSLKDSLYVHLANLKNRQGHCHEHRCEGIASYLELWKFVYQLLRKIDKYTDTKPKMSIKFVQLLPELVINIIMIPMCVTQIPEAPEIDGELLYSYLSTESGMAFRKNLERAVEVLELLESESGSSKKSSDV